MVNCVPKEGSATFDGAAGAFTWAFVLAASTDDFLRKVRDAFSAMDLDIEDVEEVEPFSQRSSRMILTKEFWAKASEAKHSGSVIHGTFHTYPRD